LHEGCLGWEDADRSGYSIPVRSRPVGKKVKKEAQERGTRVQDETSALAVKPRKWTRSTKQVRKREKANFTNYYSLSWARKGSRSVFVQRKKRRGNGVLAGTTTEFYTVPFTGT